MFHPPFGRSSLEPTTRILGRRPWADSLRPSLSCHGATCRQSDSTCNSSFSHSPWFILSRTQWKAWIVIIMLWWFLEGKQVTSLNNVMNLGFSHCLAKAQSHWSRCYDLGVCTVWHLQCDVFFFFRPFLKTNKDMAYMHWIFRSFWYPHWWFCMIFWHIWTYLDLLDCFICGGFLRVFASSKAQSHLDSRCYTFPKTRRMVADTFAGHGLKEFKDWSVERLDLNWAEF